MALIIIRQDSYGAPVTIYRGGVVEAENVPPEVVAEAPNLLAALKALVASIDALGPVSLPKMDAARAVIARAEGRS